MLCLFDIDGTLLIKAADDHRDAIHAALKRVYHVPNPADARVSTPGRTDPWIARAILLQLGVSAERIDDGMSEFKRVQSGNVKALASLAAAPDVWTVAFKETQPGTMVRGDRGRDVPSHGRAWIDSTTGRILRTEHIGVDTFVRAEIDVTYRAEAGLSVLVPGEMRENYVVQQTVTINGRATYSRFRQFTVTTTEKSKPQ